MMLPGEALVKGDSRSASIAAASIVGKVVRDRVMQGMECLYPGWGFERHKGYPTQEHREILQKRKPSMIHRHSFQYVGNPDDLIQPSLFWVMKERKLDRLGKNWLRITLSGSAIRFFNSTSVAVAEKLTSLLVTPNTLFSVKSKQGKALLRCIHLYPSPKLRARGSVNWLVFTWWNTKMKKDNLDSMSSLSSWIRIMKERQNIWKMLFNQK